MIRLSSDDRREWRTTATPNTLSVDHNQFIQFSLFKAAMKILTERSELLADPFKDINQQLVLFLSLIIGCQRRRHLQYSRLFLMALIYFLIFVRVRLLIIVRISELRNINCLRSVSDTQEIKNNNKVMT